MRVGQAGGRSFKGMLFGIGGMELSSKVMKGNYVENSLMYEEEKGDLTAQ
jgi:hypothetical protein